MDTQAHIESLLREEVEEKEEEDKVEEFEGRLKRGRKGVGEGEKNNEEDGRE
jgi:hypothetical protein